jgi:hypothetical protein
VDGERGSGLALVIPERTGPVKVNIHVVGQMADSRLGQRAVIEACHGRREVVSVGVSC